MCNVFLHRKHKLIKNSTFDYLTHLQDTPPPPNLKHELESHCIHPLTLREIGDTHCHQITNAALPKVCQIDPAH